MAFSVRTWTATLLALALASPAQAATAISLEGRESPVTEPWSALPWPDLDRVLLGASDLPKAGLGVWLADGSWLPATSLAADGRDHLLLHSPLGDITLPLTAVRGWGPTEPPAGAHDRVQLAGGPVEGQVLGLAADGALTVRTALDPEPLRVPLADVAAAALQVPALPPASPAVLVMLALDRPPARLLPTAEGLRVALGGSAVHLTTGTLIVEGPRRTWLANLAPIDVHDDGAFGVVWPWKANTDLYGDPLRLGGQRPISGISVHSAATLTWELGGAYTRFRTRLGIADLIGAEGDADVTLLVDNTPRWHEPRVRGSEPPHAIDLDLTGAHRLTLHVALGERYDIGDHITLADAYLVRTARPNAP